MSGKLDQSLDQIMTDTKPAGGRGRGRRPRTVRNAKSKAKAAIAAPTGGVQKTTKANAKQVKAAAPPLTAAAGNESKIIVSNLPEDVTEMQIKDYFGQTIGHVKKVLLTYGPNGRSRGVATIIFRNAEAGQKAAKQLDGVKVDGKAMKIEVVVGAKLVPAPPQPKSLADRMSQPKSAAKEKEKAKPKANGAAATTNGAGKGKAAKGKKGGRGGKPKKKTADELDAEMMDYFGGDAAPAPTDQQTAAAAPAAADTGMVDEVM